jgi:hypothetical protein
MDDRFSPLTWKNPKRPKNKSHKICQHYDNSFASKQAFCQQNAIFLQDSPNLAVPAVGKQIALLLIRPKNAGEMLTAFYG